MATQYLWPGRVDPPAAANAVTPSGASVVVTPGSGGVTISQSGSAPATPPPSTLALPGSKLFGWGSSIHRVIASSAYTDHASWGFTGARANIGYLSGYGGNQTFKGTTAAGDSGTSGPWILQRSYEGLPTTDALNGNSNRSGLGLFKSGRQPGILAKAYLGFYVTAQTHPATGLFGDIGNSAVRADVATKVGGLAAFVSFVGGDGVAFDLETGTWDNPTGTTQAQNLINIEQLGFEVGTAIWTANPALEVVVYNLQPNNSWHECVTSGFTNGGRANAALSRVQFMFGVWRAGAALAATGRTRWIDHFFYRGQSLVSGASLITALRWNTQGTLAGLSRDLPTATWKWLADKLDISPFSWAGTDNGNFYNSTQESQPTWTNNQETYRQHTMGQWRCEYTQDQGFPGGNAQYGLYATHNNYSFPTGRLAGMATALSTSASFSTAAPTISTVTASGRSGNNITLSFNAAHAFGIRCILYKVYASNGTTLVSSGAFTMTFDLNGGSPTLGITSARQAVSQQIVAAAGTYVVITAYSTLSVPPTGQQVSTVKAV